MLEGAWSLYISFQNYNIQEGTGKVIYKPSIFDEEQLHVKQDQSRSHKSAVYPRTVTTRVIVAQNKKKLCARAPNSCMCLRLCPYA